MNPISRARWTRRMGYFREETIRFTAVSSSVVNVRSLIGFRIRSPGGVSREYYTSRSWREGQVDDKIIS
jgi:hypothetical protein